MTTLDVSGQARLSLREIVADYSAAALDDQRLLGTLLPDLLAGSPRETKLILAAASIRTGGLLSERISRGIPIGAAIVDVAALLAADSMIDGQICQWIVTEYARVLGHVPADDLSPDPVRSLGTVYTGTATVVSSPPTSPSPGAPPSSPSPGIPMPSSPGIPTSPSPGIPISPVPTMHRAQTMADSAGTPSGTGIPSTSPATSGGDPAGWIIPVATRVRWRAIATLLAGVVLTGFGAGLAKANSKAFDFDSYEYDGHYYDTDYLIYHPGTIFLVMLVTILPGCLLVTSGIAQLARARARAALRIDGDGLTVYAGNPGGPGWWRVVGWLLGAVAFAAVNAIVYWPFTGSDYYSYDEYDDRETLIHDGYFVALIWIVAAVFLAVAVVIAVRTVRRHRAALRLWSRIAAGDPGFMRDRVLIVASYPWRDVAEVAVQRHGPSRHRILAIRPVGGRAAELVSPFQPRLGRKVDGLVVAELGRNRLPVAAVEQALLRDAGDRLRLRIA